MERLEVVGIHQANVCDGQLGELPCVVFERNGLQERFAAKRRMRDERRGTHPWNGAQPVKELIEELHARRALAVLRCRQGHICEDDVLDGEPCVHVRQAEKAGSQESGQHQQYPC